jgi:hypothetical protein
MRRKAASIFGPSIFGRRHVFGLVAGAIGVQMVAPAGAAKAPQSAVQYQPTPRDGERCGVCRNFDAATGSCTLVAGSISPDGWCALFTAAG